MSPEKFEQQQSSLSPSSPSLSLPLRLLEIPPYDGVSAPCIPPNYPPFYHWDESKHKLLVEVPEDRETIPDFAGELLQVRCLEIRGGKNLKSLPHSIATLSRLKSLSFDRFDGVELQLPPNLGGLVSLKTLSFCCSRIKSLPAAIMGLTNLQSLSIECPNLEELPENLNTLVSLKQLHICDTGIKTLPDSITGLTNLESLYIEDCPCLEALPVNMNGLVGLNALYILGLNIRSLPESITMLQNLETLSLLGCDSLEELPANLNKLPKLWITFPRYGEGLGDYIAVPTPEQETVVAPSESDREVTPSPPPPGPPSDDAGNVVSGRTTPDSLADEQLLNKTLDQDMMFVNATNSIGGEEIAHYVAVRPSKLETQDEYGMSPVDGQTRALASSVEDGRDAFGSRNSRIAEYGNMLKETSEEKHGKVSWLTRRPNKRSRSAPEEKSCIGSSCASNSLLLTLDGAVDREHLLECLDNLNIHGGSDPLPSEYHKMKKLRPNTSRGAIEESDRATDHPVSSHGSGVDPSPLVVKGTYKEEIFRFEFSYTPCIDELKREVGEKLELEFGKFELEFKDDEDSDDEWVVMKDNSDLQHCLRLSRSVDSKIVRLKLLISDLDSNKWLRCG